MAKTSAKSSLIINIAVAAVAISISVMLIAVAIVKGYQLQITNKITGFSNDIQITRLDFNNSFETNPIYKDSLLEANIKTDERIKFVQPFAIKAGIIKTDSEFEGIVLKGINEAFDWNFIQQHLVSGSIFTHSDSINHIVISENTAKKLSLQVHQPLIIYFIQDDGSLPRARKFIISGIYNTGLSDLDALYGIIDMKHIQKLNKWDEGQISGYEVKLKHYSDLNVVAEELYNLAPYHMQVKPITQIYPQLFDWLALLDLNVLVIIVLMIIVACINMSTAILILIVERSNMIGMFKAMGSSNTLLQRIFTFIAGSLILRGLMIGNAVGLIICFTQQKWQWIKLNEADYFLSTVPIELTALDFIWINASAFILCLLIMLLPVKFVAKINPIKSIRFQ
jgi:lipoprotein-releasing system permease protein